MFTINISKNWSFYVCYIHSFQVKYFEIIEVLGAWHIFRSIIVYTTNLSNGQSKQNIFIQRIFEIKRILLIMDDKSKQGNDER